MGHFEDEVALTAPGELSVEDYNADAARLAAQRAEADRAARAAGAGIGVPDNWEETKAAFLAERDAQAAAAKVLMVARVRAVIRAGLVEQGLVAGFQDPCDLNPDLVDLDGTLSMGRLAAAVVARLFEGAS